MAGSKGVCSNGVANGFAGDGRWAIAAIQLRAPHRVRCHPSANRTALKKKVWTCCLKKALRFAWHMGGCFRRPVT